MFTAFVRNADGTTGKLNSIEELPSLPKDGAEVWIDLEDPTSEEIDAVDTLFSLSKEAWDDCLAGDQRPRIDEFENCIFVVSYGLLGPGQKEELRPRKLAAFCGSHFLITIHQEPLQTINRLRERYTQRAKAILPTGVDHLFYTIMDKVVDNYLLVASVYEDRLEELEERSLSDDFEDHLLADVAEIRRKMLTLRHLAQSQLELIKPISENEYDYISESLGRQFDHVRDHLLKLLDHVTGLREILNGIRDNYQAALTNRMNKIMQTLTIFASIMLPLTFIAGVYGMNVPLWPMPEHPASFWGICGMMALIAIGLLWFFRRKRWL